MTTLYGNFPVLLPGSTESVSRNGLKKTSKSYLSKTNSLPSGTQNAFPAPTIRMNDLGLYEISLDEYSLVSNSTPNIGYSSNLVSFSKTFYHADYYYTPNNKLEIYEWTLTQIYIVNSKIIYTATSANGSVSPDLTFTTPQLVRSVIKGRAKHENPFSVNWVAEIASVTRRNFGNFDEVDIVITPQGTLVGSWYESTYSIVQ